jgi:LmbE family N-acetylglucosaminyl deacetylase
MLATIPATSLLLDPERHPLCPAEAAAALGHTIVFAPHPDDESLGCGGLLALLAGAGIAVTVVIVTDGSRSHPNSVSHSSGRLASIREAETLDAVAELGLAPSSVQFLRYPDCGLPYRGTSIYREAIARLRRLMTDMRPETMLVPWRRDPHSDHIGTWHLLRSTVDGMRSRPRWLEYPVWAWPHAHAGDAPRHDEACAWRIDISSVLARKQRAIAQHRSQLGRLIHDDPEGFVLEPAMLAYFAQPWELFIEPHDG